MTDKQKSELAKEYIFCVLNHPAALKLIKQLKEYHSYTYRHCINVATESLFLGVTLGLDKGEFMALAFSAVLHDIGKITIPYELIEKPGIYTGKEKKIMSGHAEAGAQLIKQAGFIDDDIISAIKYHHENEDGTGYFGLKNNEIPVFAKIIRITDTYDALTDDRPYHQAKSSREAIDCISEMTDILDKNMVAAFVEEKEKGKNILACGQP